MNLKQTMTRFLFGIIIACTILFKIILLVFISYYVGTFSLETMNITLFCGLVYVFYSLIKEVKVFMEKDGS